MLKSIIYLFKIVFYHIKDNLKFFKGIKFTDYEKGVAQRLISEIINRLTVIMKSDCPI